jgi:nucleoside-diphosphate-sugar epimerase
LTTPRYEPAVTGELRNSIADITAARESLGYEPRYRFETEIAQVVRDIREAIEP